MEKEYKDEQIGDLDGDEGVHPMATGEDLAEQLGDEDELYDYGELTDGDMCDPDARSQVPLSNLDLLEAKQAQDKEIINEAVDEFIQDKRFWFRNLHKDHGSSIQSTAIEKGKEFKEGTALFVGKDVIPIQGELEEEEFKRIVKERTLENAKKFQEEDDAKGSDYESEESEQEEQEKWDAETILSTYTNTDNHPSVIKFTPRVKAGGKMKIELHK